MLELTILGNLCQDATIKDFNGQPLFAFTVADNDVYTDAQGVKHEKTTYVSCLKPIYNNNTNLGPYLKKGVKVLVRGKASARVITNDDSTTKAGLNCRVEFLELCGGAKRTENPVQAPQTAPVGNVPTAAPKTQQTVNYAPNTAIPTQPVVQMPTKGEDDLPF